MRLYLNARGGLEPAAPSSSDDELGATSYDFDPASPVPTIGGGISAADEVMIAGGFDQRLDPRFLGGDDELPLSSRPDVVSFQTEPLPDPIAAVGPVQVTLWVSSSAPDTDFTAKLLDVHPAGPDYPRGYALNLCDSIVRARYRSDRAVAEPMEPGEPYEVSITLYPTANLFAAGHRIRLDVSSSNFPRFDVNPNTGEPLGTSRSRDVAHNAVHHAPKRPSHLVLWVVPEITTEFHGARAGVTRSLSSTHALVNCGPTVGANRHRRPAEPVMENTT
jgi:putative CocE/NonD family hydrolase